MEYKEDSMEFWEQRSTLLNEMVDMKEAKCKRFKRIIWFGFLIGNAVGLYGGYTIAREVFTQ